MRADRTTAASALEDWPLPDSHRTPVLYQQIVGRDKLVTRLLGVDARHVVTVVAPAGYGKTTTVALWGAKDDRPFHWVHLTALDNDPVHLVRHVAVANGPLGSLDTAIVRTLTSPGSDVDRDMLPAIALLLEEREPAVLVFDELEVLSSPDSLHTVEGLLACCPDHCQIILVGRTVEDVALARTMMTGALTEVSADDLAMDVAEARLLFANAGLALSDRQAEELVARTEGWPGGLHIAQLACARGDVTVGDWLSSYGGRHLADYLSEEVLDAETPEMVAFLEQSALLDRMSASLLDELFDRSDSAEKLEEIERSGNLFLVPLDDDREWYRYHALFGTVLRSRLRRRDADLVRDLDRRASVALERRCDVDGAIRHAVKAGDTARAADLVLGLTMRLVNQGRVGLLGQWLELVGLDAIEELGSAAIAWAWYGLSTGDIDLVKHAIAAAEQRESDGPLADGSPSVGVAAALVRGFAGWNGIDGVIRDSQLVREAGEAKENPWWVLATTLQGTALAQLGEYEAARERLSEAFAEVVGSPATEAAALTYLALLTSYDDDLEEAVRLADQALGLLDRYNLKGVLPMVPLLPVAALLAARSGRPADARRYAADARAMITRLGFIAPRASLFANLLLAKTALALGDVRQARELAKDAERARRRDPSPLDLSRQLDELLAQLASPIEGVVAVPIPALTSAELRVLTYLPTHFSLREIGGQLVLSRNTIKSHCVSIYRKLCVSSRAEAVETARRLGIL